MQEVSNEDNPILENTAEQNPNLVNEDNEKEINKDKFKKVMNDFISDLVNTFPEFQTKLPVYYDENNELRVDDLLEHCNKIYPERFFDFLYKNEDIITDETINTEILPTIDLEDIWQLDGITDTIKDTIWKYLQLILFSIVGDINDKNMFGDTAKLFEAIDETQLKEKMEESMKDLFELFNKSTGENEDEEDDDNEETKEDDNENPDFLNPENIQEHLSSLLDGKLGKLATEIAEETAKDLNLDMENVTSTEDVMKQLFSNPTKVMNLVKKVGGKLDSKIKAGDIKESELMAEAGEIMKKMKGMPGMKDMNKLFKSMGMPGGMPNMGKNSKVNMGAFKTHMKKQETKERMKERAKEKVKQRQEEKRIAEEFEKKRKEFMENNSVDIDKLVAELEQIDDNTKTQQQSKNKKKKKKNKK
jgi:hypothetical protein